MNPSRRSIRGFKPDPVPTALVREIIQLAMRAPSSLNNALIDAAGSREFGCVINSQGITRSRVVREHAALPDDQVIMIRVAIGWPDDTFPADAVVSQRKSVDDAVVFIGFDDA